MRTLDRAGRHHVEREVGIGRGKEQRVIGAEDDEFKPMVSHQ